MNKKENGICMLRETQKRHLFLRAKNIMFKSHYSSKNILLRWIFWKRCDIVLNMIGLVKRNLILDFGTQSGTLLPSLSVMSKKVIGIDIDETTFKANIRIINDLKVNNVDLILCNASTCIKKKLDVIIAMDVLEHIPEPFLSNIIVDFLTLLNDDGILIISLPVENIFYKLSQKIIGSKSEDSEHIHTHHRLYNILNKYFICECTRNLIFFKILRFKPKHEIRKIMLNTIEKRYECKYPISQLLINARKKHI